MTHDTNHLSLNISNLIIKHSYIEITAQEQQQLFTSSVHIMTNISLKEKILVLFYAFTWSQYS